MVWLITDGCSGAWLWYQILLALNYFVKNFKSKAHWRCINPDCFFGWRTFPQGKQLKIWTFPQILLSLFRKLKKKSVSLCYPQTLKYEINVRTCIYSPNDVEENFVEDIQSTSYININVDNNLCAHDGFLE